MRSVLGTLLVVVGCATRVAVTPTATPDPPRAGVVADAQPLDAPLPTVGEFVLVRGGEKLLARPDPDAPAVTLPADPEPFVGPIAAKAVAVHDAFVEVEMLADDAESHCGVANTYADALRGFVHRTSLVDVTTASSRVTLTADVVVDIPSGIAVDDTVIESDGERFEIPIDPAVVGRSYAAAPTRCLDSALDKLVETVRVPPSFEVGRIGRPAVAAWFESGEPLGSIEPPREVELGPPHPEHPSRRCFAFATLSGVTEDATVCVEPPARRGPPFQVPAVEQGKHRVDGPLDADIVRRIVRAHINEVRHCYNEGLKRDSTLRGTVTVFFEIAADGKVARSRVESTNVPDVAVGTCIAAATSRWLFPKPTGGKKVKVTYPFELRAPPPP